MAKYSGYAATLEIDSSGYSAVVQVRDISGPSFSADTIDISCRQSAGGFREHAAGMRDAGDVTFDVVYDPDTATHSASTAGGLVKLLSDGTNDTNFRLTLSDTTPTTLTFAGIVTGFTPQIPYNDAMTADFTVKVDGAVTWA